MPFATERGTISCAVKTNGGTDFKLPYGDFFLFPIIPAVNQADQRSSGSNKNAGVLFTEYSTVTSLRSDIRVCRSGGIPSFSHHNQTRFVFGKHISLT